MERLFVCLLLCCRNQTEDEISKLAKSNLKELVNKWSNIFTPDLVESNIHLLKDHVQTFFNEILSETDKKEETILKRIEGNRSIRFLHSIVFKSIRIV